jgi:hypothetical protein
MASFRVTGLSPSHFEHLFHLHDAQLSEAGGIRYVVDDPDGFPDRIEMRDLKPGEVALLVNYEELPSNTPYRSRNAIFVREGATQAYNRVDEVPEVMRKRLLSVRGFDSNDMMIEADVIEGERLEGVIQLFFANPNVAYIHVHNARRGCYSGRIDRA